MKNYVNLLGILGKDPEIRTVGEKKVCNFTVATHEYFKGEQITTWHYCVAWNGTADVVSKMHQGDTVDITGSIKYETYEKDGVKKTTTKIESHIIRPISRKQQKESNDMPY
jgi:single-strand DNA-binding protein